jgi:hypothetical protein
MPLLGNLESGSKQKGMLPAPAARRLPAPAGPPPIRSDKRIPYS